MLDGMDSLMEIKISSTFPPDFNIADFTGDGGMCNSG